MLVMNIKDGRSLLIRSAVPEDAEEIVAYLNLIGAQSHHLSYGKEGSGFHVKQEQEYIKKVADSATDILLVGIVDNKVVSVANCTAYAKQRMAHRCALGVSVEQSFWHQGIARAMMQQLIAFAQANDITEVLELEVLEDNAHAIHLYQSLGFHIIGRYENYMKIDEVSYGAYFMYKHIAKT